MPIDQQDREVDEGVLAEQDLSDQRDVGEDRDVKMRRLLDPLADEVRADQSRQADTEDRQREAGRDLVDREPQREQREDRRHAGAGRGAGDGADGDRAREIGRREAAGGAHDHHALEAEIEHAGALDDELARCGEQQRRRRRDHREKDGFKQSHERPRRAM